MGWLPDYPDLRDYTERTDRVREVLESTGLVKAKTLPSSVFSGGPGFPLPA